MERATSFHEQQMHKLTQQTAYKAFWIDALLAEDVPKLRSTQQVREIPEISRSSEETDDSEHNPSSMTNCTSVTSTGSPFRQPISDAINMTDIPIDLCRQISPSSTTKLSAQCFASSPEVAPPGKLNVLHNVQTNDFCHKYIQYENRYPLLSLPRPNLHSDLQRLLRGIEEARQYVVASRAFDCIEPVALPTELPVILPLQSPRQRKAPSDTECSESELPNSCSGSDGNKQTFEEQGESRKKRARVSFSNEQVMELERRFYRQRYLSSAERSELARTLDLSETQSGLGQNSDLLQTELAIASETLKKYTNSLTAASMYIHSLESVHRLLPCSATPNMKIDMDSTSVIEPMATTQYLVYGGPKEKHKGQCPGLPVRHRLPAE
ncbi:unnamed protein product [Schistocephalus solidus]|uniref:Homeobox domain-containing protein n=1 Tax=Schistocephalus solidus TaxID=70667 RepID=A0A183T051_SCHSO|nr:unnamed protein product [Schistocephalus solidus]